MPAKTKSSAPRTPAITDPAKVQSAIDAMARRHGWTEPGDAKAFREYLLRVALNRCLALERYGTSLAKKGSKGSK